MLPGSLEAAKFGHQGLIKFVLIIQAKKSLKDMRTDTQPHTQTHKLSEITFTSALAP